MALFKFNKDTFKKLEDTLSKSPLGVAAGKFKDFFQPVISPLPDKKVDATGPLPTSTPTSIPTSTPTPSPQILPGGVRIISNTGWKEVPKNPTPTQKPSSIPKGAARIDAYPEGPGTPDRSTMFPKLQAKEIPIQSEVFDAIINNIPDDYDRRLALATAYQESTGGVSPVGDQGRSFGPFHIMPGNAPPVPGYEQPTEAQAKDPNWSAKFINDYLKYNELKVGKERRMLRWNSRSGYDNIGPKYDEDIPRAATMSSYFRK